MKEGVSSSTVNEISNLGVVSAPHASSCAAGRTVMGSALDMRRRTVDLHTYIRLFLPATCPCPSSFRRSSIIKPCGTPPAKQGIPNVPETPQPHPFIRERERERERQRQRDGERNRMRTGTEYVWKCWLDQSEVVWRKLSLRTAYIRTSRPSNLELHQLSQQREATHTGHPMSAVRCDGVQGPLPRPRYAPWPESSDHPAASLVTREPQLSCHASFCADASSLRSPHRRKTHSLPEAPGTPEDDECD
ncbi:hypothetical protein MHYP_G00303130 [Metynnis hypsauchen]